MAKLTLTLQAHNANSLSVQRRLVSAVKATAEYWKNYALDTIGAYNEAVRKRKIFASQILQNSSIPSPQAYAEYLLGHYSYEGEPEIDTNGEVEDVVLADSTASAATYDYFAGVKAGDETTPITF